VKLLNVRPVAKQEKLLFKFQIASLLVRTMVAQLGWSKVCSVKPHAACSSSLGFRFTHAWETKSHSSSEMQNNTASLASTAPSTIWKGLNLEHLSQAPNSGLNLTSLSINYLCESWSKY